MKKILYLTGLLICLIHTSSRAKQVEVPLLDRIKDAEYVFIGKLKDIERKVFSVTEYKKGSEGKDIDYITFYDVGDLEIEKMLKGSWPKKHGQLQFFHPNQSTHPFRHMHLSFDENQEGIWMLHRNMMGGYLMVIRPDNFLPIEKLPEVEKVVNRH